MDGTNAARCEGDVRKLTHFFETLGTSSPDTRKDSEKIINRKGSAGSGTTEFRGLVAGGGASVDERQYAPCNECLESHPPCYICYKVHHSYRCPYFDHFPRGARFAPGYEIVCECGNEFNEDRWACTFCGGGGPVLRAKYCFFCNVFNKHNEYECPEDPVLAAEYKLVRDKILLRVPGHDDLFYPESS